MLIGGSVWFQRNHSFPRVLSLSPTVEAYLIRALIDGENAAEIAVMASEEQLNNPTQECHNPIPFADGRTLHARQATPTESECLSEPGRLHNQPLRNKR